jgi:GT2 family glycosyltransferase
MVLTTWRAPEVPSLSGDVVVRDLVSVVLPTWNRAYVLPRAVESVLAQGYPHIELLVVDDGSTDDTAAVAARYGAKVRYLARPNGGVAAARNTGLAAVRGEFVALLDSDDEWLPWKVEAQVAVFRKFPEVGMVWSDMTAVDEHGVIVGPRYLRTFYAAYQRVDVDGVLGDRGALEEIAPMIPTPAHGARVRSGMLFPQILHGNLVHTSTAMLRRDRLVAVGGFDESLQGSGEDYDFHLRTCVEGPVALIDTPTIRYRVGAADQLTAPPMLRALALNDLRTVERWLGPEGDQGPLPVQESRARLSRSHGWVGERLLLEGETREAREQLWASWRLRPAVDRRTLLLGAACLPKPIFVRVHRLWWWVRHGRNPPA